MATELTTPAPVAVQLQRLLKIPGAQHLGTMLVVATMIAVIFAGYLWSQAPDYKVLFSDLPERDGGSVLAALDQMNVPYKFSDGGTLMIPADQIYKVKMRLSQQGLPKSSTVGWDDPSLQQKAWTGEDGQQIIKQRALEGELARTIQSISAVKSARVHLALTKPTAFMREQPKPSASVFLHLYPGGLDASQVGAVIHLVSNGVPGLHPKSVSVIDQNGNPLSTENGAGRDNTIDGSHIKLQQAMERSYIARIEAILGPLTGNNNVRAQVTADLDFSVIERAEKSYKPNQTPQEAAIRSQQTSETVNAGGNNAGGIPGALSNQPPGPATAPITTAEGTAAPGAPAAAPAATVNSQREATTNYEVGETLSHTRLMPGRVKRLTVAVIVNHRKRVDSAGKVTYVPLAEAEIASLTALVRDAVAFDKDRGDTVSVVNSRFTAPEQEKIVELPLWKQPEMIDMSKTIGKNALIAGLLLFVVLGVLRPMLKTLGGGNKRQDDPVEAASDGVVAQLPEMNDYAQQVERAKTIARDDPRVVANVVKEWVSDGK